MFQSVPKFAFWGWFGKIHIEGRVRAVFQKSLFWKMVKKFVLGIALSVEIAISRACVCYVVVAFAPGCSWLCCPTLKTFCFGLVVCWWWDLSALCLKWLKWACLGANMAFFDLGASRMCVRVCMWVGGECGGLQKNEKSL